MTWIIHPVALEGKVVSLTPLQTIHFDKLINLSKVKRIWKHYTIDASDTQTLLTSLETSLFERDLGKQYPFVIVHNETGDIAGSTRLLDIQQDHKKLEIGWTWLHPDYWGSKVNIETKFLLLNYCFETLHSKRVQLKTDEKNIRSRKAIEKIGGRFEGIHKNDMIREDGTSRNSAYYSIIESEWARSKSNLIQLLE